MPNLIPNVDFSEYFDHNIFSYYKFTDCNIQNVDYKLKHSSTIENGINVNYYLLTTTTNDLLAVLRLTELNIHGKIYHKINKSYSVRPQNGHGEILYRFSFNIHPISIISDGINTLPGSFNLWKKIINKSNIDIFKFDLKNNRKHQIHQPLDEFLIWGVDDYFLETIKSTPWEAVIFENEFESLDDNEEDNFSVDYLSDNDRIERTILSDYIVKALKNKNKITNRSHIVLLIEK